ncbi:hypothetical protein ACCS68_06550 [Rhizobium beringeri]|uniref:hypothetical protein n=1 Tax=Rhizobium TaxID=379 RepID=UPI001441CDCC|nr:hypothetical protein [Rhizobium leguminosarum]
MPKQDVARFADTVDLRPIGIQLLDVGEGLQMVRGVDRGKVGGRASVGHDWQKSPAD